MSDFEYCCILVYQVFSVEGKGHSANNARDNAEAAMKRTFGSNSLKESKIKKVTIEFKEPLEIETDLGGML